MHVWVIAVWVVIMKELQQDIESKNFRKLYLFFGEERFLVSLYERRIRGAVLDGATYADMNVSLLEGRTVGSNDILMASATLPFMASRRLVIVRDSGLFASGRKQESEDVAKLFEGLPQSTTLIFVEEEVDRRLKIHKKAVEHGFVADFSTPSESQLLAWVERELKKAGKSIRREDASLILRYAEYSMFAISSEMEKLVAFAEGGHITQEDIEAVCIKPGDARIFELIDAVVAGDYPKAMVRLEGLTDTHPLVVITMLARQFRIILLCGDCAKRGMQPGEIARATALRPFQVSSALRQAKGFEPAELARRIEYCAQADYAIKTGQMADHLALELLILNG